MSNANGAGKQVLHDGSSGGFEVGNPTALTSFLGITPSDQEISTDNDTLLQSDISSWIRVTNPNTGGSATSFTVGIKAGTFDGQVCFIQVMKDYALEMADSVTGSADITFENNNSVKAFDGYNSGDSQRSSGMFTWQSSDSTWYEITLTQTTVA